MMIYRIVPVIGESVLYKIQVKSFFGWKNKYSSHACEFGIIEDVVMFDSIKKANEYMIAKYGTSSEQEEYHLK